MPGIFLNRVRAGIKYLDEKDPEWLSKISLTKLDLGNVDCCIIGQTCGMFWNHVKDPGNVVRVMRPTKDTRIPWNDAVSMGFASDDAFTGADMYSHADYQILNRTWKREIRKLRKERFNA